MRAILIGVALLGLQACAPAAPVGPAYDPGPGVVPLPPQPAGPPLGPGQAAEAFTAVVARVEPVAEAMCRERTRGVSCDFQIGVDRRAGLPANAAQSLDPSGRPVITFTAALIEDARNADELAFVLGHEAAHHIAGHIPRQQQTAATGALLAGVLASLGGADQATVRSVQQIGANVGARTYSRDFELEADALGTEVAWRAGYDPARGAAFFDRLPDPGDQFLGSHPPNAQRRAVVAQALRALQGG
jgi:Zn-dependent protease with chaperone function